MKKLLLLLLLVLFTACEENVVDILKTNYSQANYTIFYTDDYDSKILSKNVFGSNQKLIYESGYDYIDHFEIIWKKSNKKMIFVTYENSKATIFVKNLISDHLDTYYTNALLREYFLSLDEEKIYYSVRIDKQYYYETDLKLSKHKFLFSTSNWYYDINWKNDNTFYTYYSNSDGSFTICEVNLDGSVKIIKDNLNFISSLKLSPDKTKLAFYERSSDNSYERISFINIDGSNYQEVCELNHDTVKTTFASNNSLAKSNSLLCPRYNLKWKGDSKLIFNYFKVYILDINSKELIKINDSANVLFRVVDDQIFYSNYELNSLMQYDLLNKKSSEVFYDEDFYYGEWAVVKNN